MATTGEPVAPPRWGATATVAWSAALMAVFFALQGLALVVFIAASVPGPASPAVEREVVRLQGDGDVLAAIAFLTTPVCVALLFGVVRLKRGARVEDTLALLVPSARTLARGLGAMAILAVASDALTLALGKPVVPPVVEHMWRSSGDKASLVVAIVVAAPLFEELLFRGFVLTGFARWPRVGVALAAGAWAAIHTQYDVYGVFTIFAMGLLLGAARVRTGSALAPMAMHAFANAWAAVEAMLAAGQAF